MRWVALAALIALIPICAAIMRARPSIAPYFWVLLGFLPLVSEGLNIDAAFISWPEWSGYVKGVEISLVDVVALAIVLVRPAMRRIPPFFWLWVAFGVATLLSVFQSGVPTASLFAVWQVVRTMLLFWAVVSIGQDARGMRMLLSGMAIGIALNAGFSLEQRLTGKLQATGLYVHQNLAGMVSHFVAFPLLGMLLGGSRLKIFYLGLIGAMAVAVLGASRGTIGLAGAGYVMLLTLSILRGATARKWSIIGLGAVGLAVAAPLAMASLERRFDNTEEQVGDYNERAAFEAAAREMIRQHPFGIGANYYVVEVNTGGYSDENNVAWASGSRSAHVHQSYLLTTAELGYPGLVARLLLLFVPLITALRYAFAVRDRGGELLLGCATSLTVVALHMLYEWVFVSYSVQTLYAMVLGMIATVVGQHRAAQRHRSRSRGQHHG